MTEIRGISNNGEYSILHPEWEDFTKNLQKSNRKLKSKINRFQILKLISRFLLR